MSAPPPLTVADEAIVVIAETLHRDPESLPREATLDGVGLGVDSLSLVRVQVALEERFDVILPDLLDEGPARTVDELVALVASARAERPS